MSHEIAKEYHSKRIHQKHKYVVRQTKIAKAYGIPVKRGEEHRLQDRAVVNCGNPKCLMCMNPRRSLKAKTIQEKRFEQTAKWME